MAVSAAINGGTLYKPYIVKSLNEPETNTIIKESHPMVVRKVVSEDTSAKVRTALENVVSSGSGRPAYMEGYRVGGKTGTAQKVQNGRYLVGNYITSFIGFFPADDPEVILYIAIDNAKGITQYGGTVAAPIARNVLSDIAKILNIEKRDGGIPKTYNYGDKKYAVVPDVVGKSTKEAVLDLASFKVEFSGNGEVVQYQAPSAGESIYEGETVRLLLTE